MWLIATSSRLDELIDGKQPATYVLLGIGFLFLLDGTIGWLGTSKKNRVLIKLFLIFTFFIFIAEIGVILTLSIFKTNSTQIADQLWNEMNVKSHHLIQENLVCCGLNGPADYESSRDIDTSCYHRESIMLSNHELFGNTIFGRSVRNVPTFEANNQVSPAVTNAGGLSIVPASVAGSVPLNSLVSVIPSAAVPGLSGAAIVGASNLVTPNHSKPLASQTSTAELTQQNQQDSGKMTVIARAAAQIASDGKSIMNTDGCRAKMLDFAHDNRLYILASSACFLAYQMVTMLLTASAISLTRRKMHMDSMEELDASSGNSAMNSHLHSHHSGGHLHGHGPTYM